jgi:2-oxoisovalerate dehydrogenase E1 component
VTTPQELDERFRAAVVSLGQQVAATAVAADMGDTRQVGEERDVSQPRGGRTSRAPSDPVRDGTSLTAQLALELFEAQLASRHLDLAARWLRSFGEGYYTIGSSGHEGNAAVAAATRINDPALLHYRSGAFYCVRAGRAGTEETDPVRDVMRGVVAAATDPISGGRHKVFGHPRYAIIPTTSTIASHLPRAVGLARALEASSGRRRTGSLTARGSETSTGGGSVGSGGRAAGARRGVVLADTNWPRDAIVVCSFGDASVNHAVAQAAFNTAAWFVHERHNVPVLFVCEDNGLGISVRSPEGWVRSTLESRVGLHYVPADGTDLADAYDAAAHAAAYVRERRRPAVLHLRMVRLMGHAGADAEVAYRTPGELAADLDRDPLLQTATMLVEAGTLTAEEVLSRYDEVGWQVRRCAEEVLAEPRLASAGEVVASLAPRRPVRVARAVTDAADAATGPDRQARADAFGGRLPENAGPLTLAQTINAALTDAMVTSPDVTVFGEDVAAKGGVYGVTKGLRDRFGADRVFDTLLDETSILGLALGAGLAGQLPVPEIQYLAYVHNAEDQLRGEAASLQFFSSGAYRNPLVVRIAGLAYQEGFGGHFHNDNSVAALRDIPGLVVAVPSGAAEAAPMLRTCLAAAEVDGTVSVFLEPIALYHVRDLHVERDNGWLASYAGPQDWSREHISIGRARVHGAGEHLTIVTFGNGVRMSLRVAARMAGGGVGVRVVDLRWLAPMPVADIVREAEATGRVLVVDETRRSGGVGEGVIAALIDADFAGAVRRVAAVDSYLPLGDATRHVLVAEEAIEAGARSLLIS